MNCYRTNCECDDIKKMYCIYKISEKQHKIKIAIAKLDKNRCIICGERTIASKYQTVDTRLCTSCGTVAIDDIPVRYCLVNSRRVG